MSEERIQLKELVEEHLSRSTKDVGIGGLVAGLATIGQILRTVQRGTAHWGPVVLELQRAIADTKAALKLVRADGEIDRLGPFADRQLAFAAVLEEELVRIEEGESTLV